jgi:hypothetical protein
MRYIQHLLGKSAETKTEAFIVLLPTKYENDTNQKNIAHLKLIPLNFHKTYFDG